MNRQRGLKYIAKHSEKFKKHIKDNIIIDRSGELQSKCYIQLNIMIAEPGTHRSIGMPYSHLVWFLTRNKWPDADKDIDHIDNDSLNNKPDNLQELTKIENQAKRRNKTTAKYGTGKYGDGLGISYDKERHKYKVYRIIRCSEAGKVGVKKWLFRGNTFEDAELFIDLFKDQYRCTSQTNAIRS